MDTSAFKKFQGLLCNFSYFITSTSWLCIRRYACVTVGFLFIFFAGDLVEQRLDAIVNPANGDLRHGGGAARAISKAAGHALEKECRDFISDRGSLSTTFVMHSTAGNLRPDIKFVIHAVGPRKSSFTSDEDLYQDVKTTVYNCLDYANSELKIQSVAIPAISSGAFAVG